MNKSSISTPFGGDVSNVLVARAAARRVGRMATRYAVQSLSVAALLLAQSAHAESDHCEQIRDGIASRINWPADTFRLEILPKDEVSTGKIMGHCDGGARKIVMFRDEAPDRSTDTDRHTDTNRPSGTDRHTDTDQRSDTDRRSDTERRDEADRPHEKVEEAPRPVASPATDMPAEKPESSEGHKSTSEEDTLSQYMEWITQARKEHPYPESEEVMAKVMYCKSQNNARSVNPKGPNYGLFQYQHPTWKGDWNPYRDKDIFDPWAQIFATAAAWEQKHQHWWGCYKTHAK